MRVTAAKIISPASARSRFYSFTVKADHVIPWQHSEKLYSLAKEPKRLILIPDGEHIDAFSDRHGDVYREQMVDFTQRVESAQN